MNNTIGKALDELYRVFDILNKKYYEDRLPYPVITIAETKKRILGWCTLQKVWQPTKACVPTPTYEKGCYEIAICAHHLESEAIYIIETLQHELIHLYHAVNDIKDNNEAQYHNKKFKAQAEKVGLVCEKSAAYGWGITTAGPDFKKFVAEEVKPDANAFVFFRTRDVSPIKKTPKKTIFKYTCPSCGLVAKAKEDTKITCTKCNKELQMEEVDEQAS